MGVPLFVTRKKDYSSVLDKAVNFKNIELKEDFFGSSPPSVFVGSKLNYPNVNVGILSPPDIEDESWLYDAPRYWAENYFTIKDVVTLRSSLINSRFMTQVSKARGESKFLDISKEIGMAYKPVDVEINLEKKPKVTIDFDKIRMPMGPGVKLKQAKLTENPKISGRVEKVVDDTDLKASKAIEYLYKHDYDENFLTQLLSIGVLGVKASRVLVPTRWGITATDDMIGKMLIKEIKDYITIDEFRVFSGNFFGNYYYILMFPEVWSYELFEGYMPGAIWNFSGKMEFATDNEWYEGRKDYASRTSGGYYAARLPILEYLKKIRKQASVLVIRFETPEYTHPLGVFVVREAARKAIKSEVMKFDNRDGMLSYVRALILRKFKYNIQDIFRESKLINEIKSQSKLKEFIQ